MKPARNGSSSGDQSAARLNPVWLFGAGYLSPLREVKSQSKASAGKKKLAKKTSLGAKIFVFLLDSPPLLAPMKSQELREAAPAVKTGALPLPPLWLLSLNRLPFLFQQSQIFQPRPSKPPFPAPVASGCIVAPVCTSSRVPSSTSQILSSTTFLPSLLSPFPLLSPSSFSDKNPSTVSSCD